ncbi:nucleotidyltransferase family protein [Pedobacter alpinus]|uniref:Nucleotidyltransferase family protein n=1 Tax=Pedobacter alpinus TaxID=1590643 RepID=A0ABW5TNN4_9SPHI
MDLKSIISQHHQAFINLCQKYQVEKIYAFGSSITSNFNPETSDIDIIVKIDIQNPADRGDALLSFWNKLEELFKRKVDLLTDDAIKNPYLKKNIDQTKKLIYDRRGEKVFN